MPSEHSGYIDRSDFAWKFIGFSSISIGTQSIARLFARKVLIDTLDIGSLRNGSITDIDQFFVVIDV
jgi:hypothetical protein